MGNLSLLTTIMDRKNLNRYMSVYQDCGLHVAFLSLGYGTVSNEVRDYLGLETNQKAVSFSIVEENSWLTVKKQLERKLKIDAPGEGIAFTIPLSSMGGMKPLQFLLETEDYKKEEETTLQNTDHHLIIVITEPGYTNMVMEAARSAGAYGGTVIHAKGTGMELAEKFMGVSLASEKELVLIVTKTELKNPIMQAIMKEAGLQTKAKSIAFSLPVADTAGLRLVEE